MPIVKTEDWQKYVDANTDPYGGACVAVARRVMELLDEKEEFDSRKIICQADEDTNTGGITGFMAGCVASMVSQCHSRGAEFRAKWNFSCQIGDEGKEATEQGKTLNPALMSFVQ